MAKTNDRTTIALFSRRNDAETALKEIKKLGFPGRDISIIMRDDEKANELGAETGTNVGKGVGAGAGAGAVVGGLAGLVIGLTAFVIPGVGPLLMAGPLTSALGLTGAAAATGAVTGAAAGGIIGALTGLGVSREEASKYEEAVRKGDVFVGVATNEDTHKAIERTMERYAARNVKTVSKDLRDIDMPRYKSTSPA